MLTMSAVTPESASEHYTTIEVARMLSLAVRSVQMMVDRGELEAWKTAGGHRRIAKASVERWLVGQQVGVTPARRAASTSVARVPEGPRAPRVLLIEDSVHYQNLVGLLIKQRFPQVALSVANDGLAGLAMYGKVEPDLLIVDILLPGIDGAVLITTLRSHPQFAHSRLIVITSLDEAQRSPYAFALQGVAVVRKTELVHELPALIDEALPLQVGLAPTC